MHRVSRVFVFLLLATFWAAARGSAAGTAELLRDINVLEEHEGTDGTGAGGPLAGVGERVVFTAYELGSGRELWGSDGTSLETRMLEDVEPGPNSPMHYNLLGTLGRRAIFQVERDSYGRSELWRSDGTPEGTVELSDSATGGPARCFDESESVLLGNRLLFTGGLSTVCGLWSTDGTVAGTVPVLQPELGSGDLEQLTVAGNRLFFFLGSELWVSDGTVAGTVLVRRFSSHSNPPRELRAAGPRVFFIAQDEPESAEELWISDGTAAGTRVVTDFFEPLPFWNEPYESLLKVIDGVLYFTANDGTGFDLWSSDGTRAGTRRITDFISANPFPDFFEGDQILKLGNRLLFPAHETGSSGLWSSGGTPQTTAPLEGCPGGCPEMGSLPLVRIGNRIVFLAYRQGGSGLDLWSSDGTGAGTRRLGNLCTGSCGFDPPALVPILGKIFYIGPGVTGYALWKTDGTPQGTVRLADLSSDFSPSFESTFAPVEAAGRIFFIAGLEDRGFQLWSSDGSPEGTGPVTVIGRSAPGSSPTAIAPFAGGSVFLADEGREGGLWRTDGTTAGTQPIPGTERAHRPVVAGGLVFFPKPVTGGDVPLALWRTDGTAAGTFQVTPGDVEPWAPPVAFGNQVVFPVKNALDEATLWGSDGTVAGTRPLFALDSYPEFLRSLGGRLYFLAYGEDGRQLFVSDGTAAGTRALTDFSRNAFEYHYPLAMASVGGTVFFAAEDRLWKTDGTPAGTSPVLPIGREGGSPHSLIEFQGALFFIGGTAQGTVGGGLWRSDGTAAGTSLLKPVGPTAGDLPPPLSAWPVVVGDRLFFVADDGVHGNELWSSDGTAAGTVMVRDIFPGPSSSQPSRLVAAGGRLVFVANDGTTGFELWESDGTAAGTRRMQDIAPGGNSSNPRDLTVAGNRLFFAADDGIHGEEPWVMPLTGGGCVPSADTLCLGGRFRVQADWRDFQGNRGKGTPVALTADTGYFWFFDAANVEVILKVLDGRGLNDHHWVFYGALSSVEYVLTVTDTQTGAVRRYVNPPGRLGSVADTEAFGPRGANLANPLTFGPTPRAQGKAGEEPVRAAVAPATACVPSATRLCLNDGRFAVEARWKDFQGNTGTGKAVTLPGGDTGTFWFFDASNVEVVLKVLDGRPLNGKYWVFYGALSSVEYTLTVTDTVTGTVKTYTNPSGRLASVADTGAF